MKKTIISLSLLLAVTLSQAQGVGMSCQYFPGLQVGFVSVKTTGSVAYNYKYGAPVPLLLIDRLSNHWYTNLDFSSVYYAATQTNKANDNRLKISKAEGSVIAGRLGYAWGKGDQFRFGFFGAFGLSTSNLDSLRMPMDQLQKKYYLNYGGGLVAYKKFGKFKIMGKIGYDIYSRKSYITKGHGLYFEGTIGYTFYQKYGLSIMPCFFSKKFDYIPAGGSATTPANAKVKSFVLRIGLTKFF